MIKRILQFLLFLSVCISAHSQAVEYNAIATAYVTTTISQNVVFNDALRQGGTYTFSVLAHNGGGRAGQSDTANVRIQFYNFQGGLMGTFSSSYNANLPNPNQAPGNPWADPSVPWSVLTVSTTVDAAAAAGIAYAKVSMYGIDGSFWAGDYGPWYRAPTFTRNGGTNLVYNPEFGPYNNITAQGWTANPGFGACQGAWGGSNPCIVNSDGVPGSSTVGLVANQNGGGPSTTGGTTSGQPGGYNSTMSTTNAGAGTGTPQTPPSPPPPVPTAIYFNNASVRITNIWPTSNNSPPDEGASNAFDNNPNTKYLNFDKLNAGVTVKLNAGRVVNGFTITTANDFPGRDPTSYKLYGSNDGVTWILIQEGNLALSNNRFTTSDMINITNATAYAYYYIMFPTTKAGTGCGLDCDSMQIAEITYYYDANNTTTSTATGGSSAPVDPVQAATAPTITGGTITQSNSPSNQVIGSGSGSTSVSTQQQTRVNTWRNGTQAADNLLHIEQVSGNYNTVNITQSGGKNTMYLGINGNSNTITNTQSGANYLNNFVQGSTNSITSTQTNTGGSHYQETKIMSGSNNTINVLQKENGSNIMFNTVTGSNNSITAVQEGTGGHYLENILTGNGHTILVNQSGTTANNASINLTNSGGPASVDLQQTGGKSFTIIQSCTNPAGCSTTIRQ